MQDNEIFELIKTFLPKYLSEDDVKKLLEDIKEVFPESLQAAKIYNDIQHDFFGQGDLIKDIPYHKWDVESGQFTTYYSEFCILSNTCDIAVDNKRLVNPNITLAFVLPLKEYEENLTKSSIDGQRIKNHINDLKKNKITSIFYLPEKRSHEEIIVPESIVMFDITTNLPTSLLNNHYSNQFVNSDGDKISSFSNYGFFTFIFKLSVHFCRLREGVFRG